MKLNKTEIVFEEARYGDQKILTLDIENEGDGLLEFEVFRMLDK